MSAWEVSDGHLSALVQSAIVEGLIAPNKADELWQQMRYDNLYALYSRYMDPAPPPVTQIEVNRTTAEVPLRDSGVWKQIRCWMYQCAEFDNWDRTVAHTIMDTLAKRLHDRHPEWTDEPIQELTDEPWGINEIMEIADEIPAT